MRPEGWKNPYNLKAKDLPQTFPLESNYWINNNTAKVAYEAGADAMLEALRKTTNVHIPYYGDGFNGEMGVIVFIPDDTEVV